MAGITGSKICVEGMVGHGMGQTFGAICAFHMAVSAGYIPLSMCGQGEVHVGFSMAGDTQLRNRIGFSLVTWFRDCFQRCTMRVMTASTVQALLIVSIALRSLHCK